MANGTIVVRWPERKWQKYFVAVVLVLVRVLIFVLVVVLVVLVLLLVHIVGCSFVGAPWVAKL